MLDSTKIFMKRVGIIYNPRTDEAVSCSRELGEVLAKKKIETWQCSAWEPDKARPQVKGTDLIISIGGDGTILRAAKAVIPEEAPILGINLGKLGFMNELTAAEAINKLPQILDGAGWIEERYALETDIPSQNKMSFALNDMFVGRRASARLVTIECRIDGEPLTVYRADGVIVATASGSTGYALAAGGPILHPQSRNIVLQPVAPHFSFDKALVLPQQAIIELKVITTHEAMISLDGQIEWQINSGDVITVKSCPHSVRFLRFQPGNYFYKSLDSKLNRKVA